MDGVGVAAVPESFGGGRCQVRGFLGQGNKKKVYLAHDTVLGRDVAIGLLKGDPLDAGWRERARSEARQMGRLGSHTRIVTVFDVGKSSGGPYVRWPGGRRSRAGNSTASVRGRWRR